MDLGRKDSATRDVSQETLAHGAFSGKEPVFSPLCPDPPCFLQNLRIFRIKHQWEATVDTLPQLVCLLDKDGCVVRVNRTAERWGLSKVDRAPGRTFHDLLHDGCSDPNCYLLSYWNRARDILAHAGLSHCEADDERLGKKVRLQLHTGTEEDIGLSVAVVHDITELKEAEDRLRCFKAELEQMVESRTRELCEANAKLTREVEERQRVEAALRVSESELKLLSAQLLTAQEMERKRIASDLHDGIGQSLSAVKFSVEDAVRMITEGSVELAVERLANLTPKIQAAVDEVRKISMNLRPSLLDDLGLLPTLGWFFREFQGVYHNLRVEKRIDIREYDVSAPLRTVIFRILQEAMNNVAKHAQATSVQVSLKEVGGIIELLLEDDGKGFDPGMVHARESSARGFGLASMRERAEFAGGTYNLSSALGHGTRIRASWPCCKKPPVSAGTSQTSNT